jgi:hypothetical protein
MSDEADVDDVARATVLHTITHVLNLHNNNIINNGSYVYKINVKIE